MVKDIEILERDHFIENKADALPATPAEFMAGLMSRTNEEERSA